MILKQEQKAGAQAVTVAAPAETSRPVEEIVRDLGSKDATVREQAESELAGLGQRATEALLAALEEEGARFRRHRRTTRTVSYCGITFLVVYVLLGLWVGIASGHWDMLSNLASFGGLFGTFGAVAAMTPRHKSIVGLMASLNDVRSIGWLADALLSDDVTVRGSATEALVRLLPQLTPANGGLLDDESMRSLDRALVKTDNSGLALAILDAYRAVGDSRSLEAIATVEQERAVTKLPAVKDAAMHAADAIRARLEKEHQAHVLLRAAEAGEDSETLLRPADGAGSEDAESLLRPSDPGAAA